MLTLNLSNNNVHLMNLKTAHVTKLPLLLGHYICDGVDPDVGQVEVTDRWFTYNDAVVTTTSGASVCDRRQRSCYILFYQRQVREQHCHMCT